MNDREKLAELLGKMVDFGDGTLYLMADYLVGKGVTIQRWIPVTEQLPEDDVEVLTRRATGMSVESRCGFGWVYDEYNGRWEVTHWMPLPQPPIKEQNRAREVENG